MRDFYTGLIVIAIGAFSAWCAFRDYDWFINNRRAWLAIRIFGHRGARICYVALGAALMLAGLCVWGFQAARLF
jgi:hypothetical protein